jgi:hypothetical protein
MGALLGGLVFLAFPQTSQAQGVRSNYVAPGHNVFYRNSYRAPYYGGWNYGNPYYYYPYASANYYQPWFGVGYYYPYGGDYYSSPGFSFYSSVPDLTYSPAPGYSPTPSTYSGTYSTPGPFYGMPVYGQSNRSSSRESYYPYPDFRPALQEQPTRLEFGKVFSTSNGRLVVTDMSGGNQRTFTVGPDVQIMVGGNVRGLDWLQPGTRVQLTLQPGSANVVTRVDAAPEQIVDQVGDDEADGRTPALRPFRAPKMGAGNGRKG